MKSHKTEALLPSAWCGPGSRAVAHKPPPGVTAIPGEGFCWGDPDSKWRVTQRSRCLSAPRGQLGVRPMGVVTVFIAVMEKGRLIYKKYKRPRGWGWGLVITGKRKMFSSSCPEPRSDGLRFEGRVASWSWWNALL